MKVFHFAITLTQMLIPFFWAKWTSLGFYAAVLRCSIAESMNIWLSFFWF